MRRTSHGFTLIELLVVVAILVALAGLVLPKLDGVVLKSNRGIAANNISGVDRYIQTYRVLHNVYPNFYDSLLDTSGALPSVLNDELTGAGAIAIHTKLKTATGLTTGDDSNLASLARVGITDVFDWDGGTDSPSGHFTDGPHTLSGSRNYATLNVTPITDPLDSNRLVLNSTPGTDDGDAREIYEYLYPQSNPSRHQIAGSKLIVMGFGRNNSAIGEVMNNAPLYPNSDPTTKYCHYLVVFEARADHNRAIFKCALGSDGDLMQGEIDEYFSQGNADN